MSYRARTLLILAALAPASAQFLDQAVTRDIAQTNSTSSLAHLRLGESLLQKRNFQAAALEFNKAEQGDLQPAWTLVWSHINLGRVFDVTGQRDRAVKEYQLALDTKDNTDGAHGVANMYLAKAPSIDDIAPLPADPDSVTNPKILTRVEPEYSAEALLAGLEGSVLISVSLARDGAVTEVGILKPLGLGLDEAALNAVRRWTFAPGAVHGQASPMVTPVELQFRLPSPIPGWHVTKIEFAKPDGAVRPVLTHAAPFAPGKMSAELAEEAMIDAAISRVPNVSISMEIDTLGKPGKLQISGASLPIWGEDAARAISEWRFTPGLQNGTAIAVPCVIQLGWFAQQ